jgi:hypothetical protein
VLGAAHPFEQPRIFRIERVGGIVVTRSRTPRAAARRLLVASSASLVARAASSIPDSWPPPVDISNSGPRRIDRE